jgi:hypothetical protein
LSCAGLLSTMGRVAVSIIWPCGSSFGISVHAVVHIDLYENLYSNGHQHGSGTMSLGFLWSYQQQLGPAGLACTILSSIWSSTGLLSTLPSGNATQDATNVSLAQYVWTIMTLGRAVGSEGILDGCGVDKNVQTLALT